MRLQFRKMRDVGIRFIAIPVIAGFLFMPPLRGGEPPAANAAPQSRPLATISADALRPHVEYLASPQLEGRGTPRGKQLARDYIVKQFDDLRLEPLFGKTGLLQEIPGPNGKDGERTVVGTNIGAWLPGNDPVLRDEFVILSAHYDHLGVRNGNV